MLCKGAFGFPHYNQALLTKILQLCFSPPTVPSALLQRSQQSVRLGPQRSVELPVVAFITAVFNQLDDHKHSPSLWLILSSASNFNTACRVHSLPRRRGSRLDQTIEIKSLHPSFLPSSPAFQRLIKSPCLFLGKLADLNTHIHTHTLHHKRGEKSSLKPPCSHHSYFVSGFSLSLSFPLPLFSPPPLSLLKCVFSPGLLASRLQQLCSFGFILAWFSPLWPS